MPITSPQLLFTRVSSQHSFQTSFEENKIGVGRLREALVDDPDEMFQLADLLDGVSVDGVDISTESHSPGRYNT